MNQKKSISLCCLFYVGRKASRSWSRLRWVLLPPQHLHAAIPPPLLAVPHFPTVRWPVFYIFSPFTSSFFFLALIFWLWSQVPRHTTNFSTLCSHSSFALETDGAQAFISIFFFFHVSHWCFPAEWLLPPPNILRSIWLLYSEQQFLILAVPV